MRVVYIANDGKEFDDEIDCLTYEEYSSYDKLYDIEIFDADGYNLYIEKNDWGEYAYNNSQTVVVHNEEELKELHRLADYTGWGEWEKITSPGIWEFTKFDYLNSEFVKVGDV